MNHAKYRLLLAGLYAIFIFVALFAIIHSTYNVKLAEHKMSRSNLRYDVHPDTLVDLQNFKYLMNNVSICAKASENPSIIIIVHTARSKFDRRYAIRNSWATVKSFNGWHLNLIFLLGIGTDELDARLSDENEEHGDMVMGNFVDSYKNLTYKHLMGYKWVSTYCSTAKYILKIDDDVFVDIFQLMEVFLGEIISSDKTYVCHNMGGSIPERNPESKWYIPLDVFPENYWPGYCSGGAYLMKTADAAKIYSISTATAFIWIDDAFVTGVLRDIYDLVVNNRRESSLQILSLRNRFHFVAKEDMMMWCSEGAETNLLNYTFVLLEGPEYIRDVFCLWNKVRLMRRMIDSSF